VAPAVLSSLFIPVFFSWSRFNQIGGRPAPLEGPSTTRLKLDYFYLSVFLSSSSPPSYPPLFAAPFPASPFRAAMRVRGRKEQRYVNADFSSHTSPPFLPPADFPFLRRPHACDGGAPPPSLFSPVFDLFSKLSTVGSFANCHGRRPCLFSSPWSHSHIPSVFSLWQHRAFLFQFGPFETFFLPVHPG